MVLYVPPPDEPGRLHALQVMHGGAATDCVMDPFLRCTLVALFTHVNQQLPCMCRSTAATSRLLPMWTLAALQPPQTATQVRAHGPAAGCCFRHSHCNHPIEADQGSAPPLPPGRRGIGSHLPRGGDVGAARGRTQR